METKSEELKTLLDNKKYLQIHLFEKGFLITDSNVFDLEKYPFYNNFLLYKVAGYNFIIHKKTSFYVYNDNSATYFLIGHAYNPFNMEIDENNIIQNLEQENIDELTGIFLVGQISKDRMRFQTDASGMQYVCYGKIDKHLYITSHMRLVGDLLDLKTSDYVKRLVSYKWYRYMLGNYLPGDLVFCNELKRVIPNTEVVYDLDTFKVSRFYPNKDVNYCDSKEEYQKVIEEGSRIMHNTLECISRKWKKPAISLTGGIDSNTTFAAANGLYDKFKSFSYVSMYRESVDAEAAKRISLKFNVEHKVFEVPNENEQIEDFDIYKRIFEHNDGDIGSIKDSDIRKKISLLNQDYCDVEVKSWVSETIRAYAYKYFGRTKFPKKLKPRNFTSLYKIFLANRKLCHETDKHFKDYLVGTNFYNHMFNYDQTDFFIWEMEHGGKCGLDIGVMKTDFDITIPYNNRKLLDLLLSVPLQKRIDDISHLDMKKQLNKELFDMNIRVVNLNETNKRKKAINLYYIANCLIK